MKELTQWLQEAIQGRARRDYLDRQLKIQFPPAYEQIDLDVLRRRILGVGLGGNGCHAAVGLARMGFAHLDFIDFDRVEPHNLTRQLLYSVHDVGESKAAAAERSLQFHSLGSEIVVHPFNVLHEREATVALIAQADFVFVLVDQPAAVFFCLSACRYFGKPAVIAGTDCVTGLHTRVFFQTPEGPGCAFCNYWGRVTPADWATYYRYPSVPERERVDLSVVQSFDQQVYLHGPSTYITAATGSHLALSVMLRYFTGGQTSNLVIDFNLYSYFLEVVESTPNLKCPLCATG